MLTRLFRAIVAIFKSLCLSSGGGVCKMGGKRLEDLKIGGPIIKSTPAEAESVRMKVLNDYSVLHSASLEDGDRTVQDETKKYGGSRLPWETS